MKIQFISDLHLESYKLRQSAEVRLRYYKKILTPISPVLVLAGDIGTFEKSDDIINFFQWACEEWEHIIYVIGNHEYYRKPRMLPSRYGLPSNFVASKTPDRRLGSRREQTPDRRLRPARGDRDLSLDLFDFKKKVAHFENLSILDRGIIKVGKIWIAGTTLWSHLDKKRSDLPPYVKQRLNITAEEYLARHRRDKHWLLRVHREASKAGASVLAVTHHCPHMNFIPQNRWTLKNYDLYATTIPIPPSREGGIKWWIFGHTHFNVDSVVGGIRYITNQCGKERDLHCSSKRNMSIII